MPDESTATPWGPLNSAVPWAPPVPSTPPLGAVAGQGGDVAADIHLPHAVVAVVGDVDVAGRIDDEVRGALELGEPSCAPASVGESGGAVACQSGDVGDEAR